MLHWVSRFAGSPLFTQHYAAGQGIAEVLGNAGDPQSSLSLYPFGASALQIQGIADASGNYGLFVPLGVPGTDYSRLTLSDGTGSTWGSETVDLRGLDASKPVQVPPLVPPPTYYTLTIGTAGTGTGSVNASPSGLSYVSGTTVTLTAVPDSGSQFVSWSGDASGSALSTTVKMTAKKSVTATFNNPDSAWNGTWTGTYQYTESGNCTWNDAGNMTITISVGNNVVSGTGNNDGLQCRNEDDCSLLDTESASATVSGTATASTLRLKYALTMQGSSCAGASWSLSLVGTLHGNTLTGSISAPQSGTFSLTKQ